MLHPDVTDGAFIAQLFQNKRTKAACLEAIHATGLKATLDRLLP